MPIYEYRCQACGAQLEKLQKLSDPVLIDCPECGRETLVKLVSASSFRLKGGGWYESDFKTGNKKNGLGQSDSKSEGEGKGEGKAEAGKAEAGTTEVGRSGSQSSEAKPAADAKSPVKPTSVTPPHSTS